MWEDMRQKRDALGADLREAQHALNAVRVASTRDAIVWQFIALVGWGVATLLAITLYARAR